MCGIAGFFTTQPDNQQHLTQLERMIASQRHRGPDAEGSYVNAALTAGLGHNRLSIIDLSDAGRQPMRSANGRWHIAFNGEIYNYLELRNALPDYPFRTHTDTEVILAAYEKWGAACLSRFIGMFAILLWDEHEQKLFAARDRFGVKPFYYATISDTFFAASEIKALHAAGLPAEPNAATWATYLVAGLYEHTNQTFWQGVESLPPGHWLTWQQGKTTIQRWYDLAESAGTDYDTRPVAEVQTEYLALLQDSVRLRFRADRPAGINLSGGLDSSLLLGLVQSVQGADSEVKAFTFVTGDERYDELPWVRQMLAHTRHPSVVCQLQASEVPALAAQAQHFQDEPFGGMPTLAYLKIFQQARAENVVVLLDGQGIDEQWCGYDYYGAAPSGATPSLIQGTQQSPVRPECLTPEFRALAAPWKSPQPFPDRLRNLQYRDARFTKIPRALRFNDRVSMQASTELREPFLDHRLFELALRQPESTKIQGGIHKWLPRQIARQLLPDNVVEAPKRPLQTPQREWLAGPLRDWATEMIETSQQGWAQGWFDTKALQTSWQAYLRGESDNSFYVWQWISLGLLNQRN